MSIRQQIVMRGRTEVADKQGIAGNDILLQDVYLPVQGTSKKEMKQQSGMLNRIFNQIRPTKNTFRT